MKNDFDIAALVNLRKNELLFKAVTTSNAEAISSLINAGADVNAVNRDGQTPLLWAADRGHTETVRLLIAKGAAVNAVNEYGNAALLLAARCGHTETVTLL